MAIQIITTGFALWTMAGTPAVVNGETYLLQRAEVSVLKAGRRVLDSRFYRVRQ
jgi:hypothetical protein